MNEREAVVSCRALKKTYQGPQPVPVLQGIDLDIHRGERVAIMGRSGSGKSTLLHLLGGLDAPSAGQIFVQGRAFSEMSEAERGLARNATLGFVYQFHHLLPEFTALENVAMPLFIRRIDRMQALDRAKRVLGEIGLRERLEHQPGELASAASPEIRPSQEISRPLRRPLPTSLKPCGVSVTTNGSPRMLISRFSGFSSFVAMAV